MCVQCDNPISLGERERSERASGIGNCAIFGGYKTAVVVVRSAWRNTRVKERGEIWPKEGEAKNSRRGELCCLAFLGVGRGRKLSSLWTHGEEEEEERGGIFCL